MIRSILGLFKRKGYVASEEVRRLRGLPEDRTLEELSEIIHDLFVRYAAERMAHEFHRKDSLLKPLGQRRVFHELMVLNLWALQKVFGGRHAPLVEGVYVRYARDFLPDDGSAVDYSIDAVLRKHGVYGEKWNDVSGHQDEFGLKAAEYLFGVIDKVPQPGAVSFWVVSYTDELMKKLKDLKKKCSNAGVALPLCGSK